MACFADINVYFFTGRFGGKFALKWIFLKSHRTLHMLLHYLVKHKTAKQAINDKLQGSVATH